MRLAVAPVSRRGGSHEVWRRHVALCQNYWHWRIQFDYKQRGVSV